MSLKPFNKLTDDQIVNVKDIYWLVFNRLCETSAHVSPDKLQERIEKISQISIYVSVYVEKHLP